MGQVYSGTNEESLVNSLDQCSYQRVTTCMGHFAMLGDSFDCHNLGGATGILWPFGLLNIVHIQDSHPHHTEDLSDQKWSIVSSLV